MDLAGRDSFLLISRRCAAGGVVHPVSLIAVVHVATYSGESERDADTVAEMEPGSAYTYYCCVMLSRSLAHPEFIDDDAKLDANIFH